MGLRGQALAVWVALLAVAAFAASPFFNRGLVGTGEAYNYSLGIADAVQQMRHGTVPPLAGQTEYAFNGRVHPLRNAPYLFYFAAAIDFATGHRLTPWQLQNVSLALSLFAAVLGCYAGLRWSTGSPPWLAGVLAAVYGLSAPLLCAAHSLDLFMTVHAAAFVPLAVAAAVRSCRQPSWSADVALASAAAATWLAHPPVAVWLTFSVLVIRLVHFALRPSWAVLARGAAALLLAAALSGFVFASVLSLNAELGFFADVTVYREFVKVVIASVFKAFPANILPVSRSGQAGNDLQFGYVPWLIFLAGLTMVYRPRRHADLLARIILPAAALLLVMLLPVPGVTPLLWRMVPGPVLTLTTEWPMQRLYLVALALTLFGFGVAAPAWLAERRRSPLALTLATALALAWTIYEATPFVRLGYANRWTPIATEQAYLSSNLELTVTAYAFLALPPAFNHGVIDPSLEFRILQDGTTETRSNLAAAFAGSPVVLQGSLTVVPNHPGWAQSQTITLLPHHRYLLTLAFKTPPFKGLMSVLGATLHRYYGLPESGERLGFGMLAGQRKSVPVWTDSPQPETVVINLAADDPQGVPSAGTWADFSLRDIDPKSLPVHLEGFLPLRFTVDQPNPESTVETPRRFLAGYRATVNGLEVRPLMSPARQVMVPIPAGHSVVELWYEGAAGVRVAFWITVVTWCIVLGWRLVGSPLPGWSWPACAGAIGRSARRARRLSPALGLALAAAVGLTYWHARAQRAQAYLDAVGPIRIDFKLPYGQLGVNQPLLTTGHRGAGMILYATIIDGKHIRISADIWGGLYQSEILPIDFFRLQTLVLSESALYPVDHPVVRALSSQDRARLRSEFRVELNGKVIILQHVSAYESTAEEINVGHANMGSNTGPDFLGEIRGASRLPIPRSIAVPAADHLELVARLPVLTPGGDQPLFSVRSSGHALTCAVRAAGDGEAQLWFAKPDGTRVESAKFTTDPRLVHHLRVQPFEAAGPGGYFGLAVDCDGRHILGPIRPRVLPTPSVFTLGLDENATPGVFVRFLGDELSGRPAADHPSGAPSGPLGYLHLIVTFPAAKDGRHEPLLTTGRTGAGDMVYLIYLDGHHLEVGVDHWGGTGAISEPIEIDYGQPHEIWVHSGALYPQSPHDPAWLQLAPSEQERLTAKTEIIFDGRAIIDAPIVAHPTTAAETTIGKNQIGMSTADPEFSGHVDFAERSAAGPPP